MCNAWNHPPGCTCGWGGEGHLGISPGGWHTHGGSGAYAADTLRWYHYSDYYYDDLCRPTTCRHCGAQVYFVRHNGGSVWLDDLGWPWPKHSCFYPPTDTPEPSLHSQLLLSANELKTPISGIFGVIIKGAIHRSKPENQVVVRTHEQPINLYIPANIDIQTLMGEPVLISRWSGVITFLNLRKTVPLRESPSQLLMKADTLPPAPKKQTPTSSQAAPQRQVETTSPQQFTRTTRDLQDQTRWAMHLDHFRSAQSLIQRCLRIIARDGADRHPDMVIIIENFNRKYKHSRVNWKERVEQLRREQQSKQELARRREHSDLIAFAKEVEKMSQKERSTLTRKIRLMIQHLRNSPLPGFTEHASSLQRKLDVLTGKKPGGKM